jgi:hypothetical protein
MHAKALVTFTSLCALAGIGCSGLAVRYEAREPIQTRPGPAGIAVYDVECDEVIMSSANCRVRGVPLQVRVLGLFFVPPKAYRRWDRFHEAVQALAQENGCPAVAIRVSPPMSRGDEPVGALCIDPQGPGAAVMGAPPQMVGAPPPGH